MRKGYGLGDGDSDGDGRPRRGGPGNSMTWAPISSGASGDGDLENVISLGTVPPVSGSPGAVEEFPPPSGVEVPEGRGVAAPAGEGWVCTAFSKASAIACSVGGAGTFAPAGIFTAMAAAAVAAESGSPLRRAVISRAFIP